MKYLPILFIALFITQSAHAQAQISERIKRLNMIFEGNIAGAMYIENCDTKSVVEYPTYMTNARASSKALYNELVRQTGQENAAQIKQTLEQRQEEIVQALVPFYKEQGCASPQAQSAKKHFQEFNTTNPQDMISFLDNIENR